MLFVTQCYSLCRVVLPIFLLPSGLEYSGNSVGTDICGYMDIRKTDIHMRYFIPLLRKVVLCI